MLVTHNKQDERSYNKKFIAREGSSPPPPPPPRAYLSGLDGADVRAACAGVLLALGVRRVGDELGVLCKVRAVPAQPG